MTLRLSSILGTLALGTALFSVMLAAPAPASATTLTGYVCSVERRPPGGTSSNPYGTASVSIYSGVACTGTYLGSMSACSSTSGITCQTEATMDDFYDAMRDAMANGFRVELYDSSPLSSSVQFWRVRAN